MSMIFDIEKLFESNRIYVTANYSHGKNGPLLANYEEALNAEIITENKENVVKKINLIGQILESNPGVCVPKETCRRIYEILK